MYCQDSVMTLTCHAACTLTFTSRTVQWPSLVTSCCMYSDMYCQDSVMTLTCHAACTLPCTARTVQWPSLVMLHVLCQVLPGQYNGPHLWLYAACTLIGAAPGPSSQCSQYNTTPLLESLDFCSLSATRGHRMAELGSLKNGRRHCNCMCDTLTICTNSAKDWHLHSWESMYMLDPITRNRVNLRVLAEEHLRMKLWHF